MSDSGSSGTSATNLFLGLASVGAGAYLGYCNARGIPIDQENLHNALKYGPTLIRGAHGGVVGGLLGAGVGGYLGGTSGYGSSALEKIAKGTGGAVAGGALGATAGGTIGAAVGGIQTLVGYCIGYMAGAIVG
jgi:hypothetical protein